MTSIHDPLYIEFIASLRRLRIEKKISQQSLSELIGKDQTFISKVETCERRLDFIEAVRWCNALGLDITDAIPAKLRLPEQQK